MSVPDYHEIKLPCGKVVLVSSCDWKRVRDMAWSDNGRGYARARWRPRLGGNGKIVFMHRFVLAAPKGSIVDHINGNTLDNRRENLQFITASRNIMKARRSSPTAGLSFDKRIQKWRLRFRIDGELKTLGWYEDFEKAKIARSVALKIIWSEEINPENYSPRSDLDSVAT